MRGTRIFVVFFSIFAVASLLFPAPLFPGNVLCAFIGLKAKDLVGALSAAFNGAFYGVALWAVFLGISRKLGE